jgi:hypothetical protein
VSSVPDTRVAYRRRRLWLIAFLVIVSIATLLVAPLLLILVEKILPQTDNWSGLSNVGQSFTGISAILSALALGAIAYTSRLQSRQVRTSQIQAVRTAQFDLMRMAIIDEGLASVLGYDKSTGMDFGSWKVVGYRNLWFMYLQMSFRVEELSERGLRRALSLELFNSPESLDYWNAIRVAFVAELTDPLGQEFIDIVDQEALKAEAVVRQRRHRESHRADES